MARLEFQDIEFTEETERIKLVFYRIYHTYIPKRELEGLGPVKVEPHALELGVGEKKAQNKFSALLSKAITAAFCSLTSALRFCSAWRRRSPLKPPPRSNSSRYLA